MDRFKFCIRPVAVFAGVIGGVSDFYSEYSIFIELINS